MDAVRFCPDTVSLVRVNIGITGHFVRNGRFILF